MYYRNGRKTQHKSQVVIFVIAYIIYTYIILLEKQNNNSQEGNNIYISDMKLLNSLHIEVRFQESKKGNGFMYHNIFIFICRHNIYHIPSNTKYRMNFSVYIFLHIIFLHFHKEFQSMYQLLFFRLTSSDGLFIVNAVKSRSILGKIIVLQHNNVYSRYKNYICC